jgi:hypothetical protein
MVKNKSIAGMSLGGGKKENFFLALLEHFEKENRWFLTSLNQVKDEEVKDNDDAITNWIGEHELESLVVDFPLTMPQCDTCELDCPGTKDCIDPSVQMVRSHMEKLLSEDELHIKNNPKKYEQMRSLHEQIDTTRSIFDKETGEHMLSRSFKRKLKKGYLPYWNRPLDYWIWYNYYDQILSTFNQSYDSFGNVSTMLLQRFKYLKKHLPSSLNLYESNTYICLIELFRAGIITKKHLRELYDLDLAPLTRLKVAKLIEGKLNVFIYEKDLELIAKHTKAFDSFLLSVTGLALIKKKTNKVDHFDTQNAPEFIAPRFS